MIKLTFHGAVKTVSGSNHLIETDAGSLVLDCGLFQGGRRLEKQNSAPFSYQPKRIKAVLISHAHLDHIGRLPLLVKQGFRGKIYLTKPTADLAKIMLADALGIAQHEQKEFYGPKDLQQTLAQFYGCDYGQEFAPIKQARAWFEDAGHILGSAIINLIIKDGHQEKKIVFSGDLGNPLTPLLSQPKFIGQADYVLVEATYGDRVHEDREQCALIVEDIIEETAAGQGVLMIPSFALERTQELLYELNELMENRRVPIVPVFMDSPLAIKATAIYQKYPRYFSQAAQALIAQGDDLFSFANLQNTVSAVQSKRINNVPAPKIIIAGSGMSEGGRILHHEKRYLPEANNTLLIIAYQAQGTRGRRLLQGKKTITIMGEKIAVRAKIAALGGYSAHADQKFLCQWLAKIKQPVKKVFVVHGELGPARALRQKARDYLGLDASIPGPGQAFNL